MGDEQSGRKFWPVNVPGEDRGVLDYAAVFHRLVEILEVLDILADQLAQLLNAGGGHQEHALLDGAVGLRFGDQINRNIQMLAGVA